MGCYKQKELVLGLTAFLPHRVNLEFLRCSLMLAAVSPSFNLFQFHLPLKMMPQSTTVPDLSFLSAKSHRSSVSAIPRPTSGTSRHATPTGVRSLGPGSELPTPHPRQDPNLHRKSWHPNNGAPPSSFRPTRSISRGSESLLPYAERTQKDLSGIQQQLYIRNLSTHSLNSPDAIATAYQSKHLAATVDLPKSKTMSNLLSSSRDITPRRRLLQPLGPPLPRTQTLGTISCFGGPRLTPSPRKPISIPVRRLRQQHEPASQLDISDALIESRMTEKEMEIMLQVQREAAANRARLRQGLQGPSCQLNQGHSQCVPLSAKLERKNRSPPAIKLSVNDVANTRRLERQRRSSSGQLIFINSGLANKYCPEADLPTPSSIASTASTDSGDIFLNDPKQVGKFQRQIANFGL